MIEAVQKKNQGRLVDWGDEQFDEYPNHSMYLNVTGLLKIVLTVDPENIKAVLATQFNDFSLGTRHAHFAPLLGDGIFTLDGNGWKDSRAMLRPQFAREQIAHVKSLEPHYKFLLNILELATSRLLIYKNYFSSSLLILLPNFCLENLFIHYMMRN